MSDYFEVHYKDRIVKIPCNDSVKHSEEVYAFVNLNSDIGAIFKRKGNKCYAIIPAAAKTTAAPAAAKTTAAPAAAKTTAAAAPAAAPAAAKTTATAPVPSAAPVVAAKTTAAPYYGCPNGDNCKHWVKGDCFFMCKNGDNCPRHIVGKCNFHHGAPPAAVPGAVTAPVAAPRFLGCPNGPSCEDWANGECEFACKNEGNCFHHNRGTCKFHHLPLGATSK